MTHCSRCRADAAGLLGHDFEGTQNMLREYAMRPLKPTDNRPYTAVSTREGALVNMHLGEAETLHIFKQTANGFQFIEERATPPPGCGDNRWSAMADSLHDCRAILVEGVGAKPLKILQNAGIRVIQMTGIIDDGLEGVYLDKEVKTVKMPDAFKCGDTCRGNAMGCA